MGKSTAWYPKLSVDCGGSGVVSQAGAMLLVRAAERNRVDAGVVDWVGAEEPINRSRRVNVPLVLNPT